MLNLFKFYETSEGLKMYNFVDMNSPEVFYEKYRGNITELKKRKSEIMKSPKYAYLYAKEVIKGRWPDAEQYIMKSLSVRT